MQNIVRTALGAQLQTCQLLGIPKIVKPFTTLNQKLDISKDIELADIDRPTVKYIAIGNGGHKIIPGVDGLAKPEPIQHTTSDTALYNHLPFVLRKTDNDLPILERAKYRLRKLEQHNEVTYIAYYLRVLDLAETKCALEKRTIVDGVITTLEFKHTTDNLSPTPPAIVPTGTLATTGDYVVATAKVPFVMTAEDIQEYLDVCTILYGDDGYAMISEIAICSGVDRVVTAFPSETTGSYPEAIDVEVINFISAFYALKFSTDQLKMNIEVGSAEALLNIR